MLFVVVAAGLGSVVERTEIKQSERFSGEASQSHAFLEESGIEQTVGETVLVQTVGDGPKATDPVFRSAVADVVQAVKGVEDVRHVLSPYEVKSLSPDGRSALVQFQVTGDEKTSAEHVEPVLEAVADVQRQYEGELRIEEVGAASIAKTFADAMGDDFKQAEYSAVPIALAILLVAFGAVVAALLPVALAVMAIIASFGVMPLISKIVPTNETTDSVMLLVGLALGVDYCLFYLRREREERKAGKDGATALEIAAATSGRAVLVSGITVVVVMCGMLFIGLGEFKAMGLSSMLVVAVAMVGSVTVLPAALSLLGERVEKGRVPFVEKLKKGSRDSADESRFWGAVLSRVLRAPKTVLALSVAALVAIAVPAIGMKTAYLTLDQEFDDSMPIVQTYERVNAAFPGGSQPAQVVVKADDVTAAPVTRAIADFRELAVSSGASRGPIEVETHEDAGLVLIDVPLTGSPDLDEAEASLVTLREEVRPPTLGQVEGLEAPIGGSAAATKDFNAQLAEDGVPVTVFIVIFAFVLMLMSFRSLSLAIASVVLNLLSVGAAYGILTMVFQHGWGASLVGAEGVGAIVTWLPLFLFVCLFGLSMDYHVFVVSRIREARITGGRSTDDAVRHGVVTTAGVVTSAAVIMVAVFLVFGTLSQQSMKQLGIGLAAAVLIDATIIRGMLLPATMVLLGERNWTMPRWLQWLPDTTHDEPAPPAAEPAQEKVPAGEPVRS